MIETILSLIVPEEILEDFEYKRHELESGVYIIYLVEKKDISHIPKSILRQGKVVSDGYMNTVDIQTFPLKGKEVYLRIKRRLWKIKGTTKSHHNSYDITTKGMKATKAFGAFLKEIGRG